MARRECCRSPAPGDTYTELFSDMGSTPIASTMKKERHFVRNWRSFLYHGNVFGNTIKFSGCSHQRIIQHFNELYRAWASGQRIACQLLHILRVCEPCTFSCPADSTLNRFWLTPSAVGDRGIDIFLHGLQAVFLLTDQLKTCLLYTSDAADE